MIDAYEIGIQLLLEEDVSSGLIVINADLAEVDRAIAATSANLEGLVRNAETATKAVAAAAGGKIPPAATGGQTADPVIEHIAQSQTEQNGTVPVSVIVRENSAPTSVTEKRPPIPAAPIPDVPLMERRSSPQETQREPAALPSALIVRDVGESSRDDQVVQSGSGQLETRAAIAPDQVTSNIAHPPSSPSQPTMSEAKRVEERHPRATLPAARSVLTASVNRAQTRETSAASPARARSEQVAAEATWRHRSTAPWSGVQHVGAQAETFGLRDRGAAPQSAEQERAGQGGGTVMLDGRLVGEWLSDHMGRQASRPPAGTSFFDPRQTPAWTISGVI